MYSNFEESTRKILVNAKKEMYDLKHPYVGSEHMLLAILKDNNVISNKLKEYKITYKKFKDEIIKIIGIGKEENNMFLYTPLLKRVIENACIDSKENNNSIVTIEHLFSSLLEEGEGVAIRILLEMHVDLDELYKEFSYNFTSKKHKKNKKLILEELGVDITKKAKESLIDRVVGRDKEINRVLEVLSRRNKNNPILIGEAGVGKTAIVEEIAYLIANNNVPSSLRGKRIISLDMATTVAGTKYRGEFEERVSKILKEIEENDDLILFIDEIHTLVGAGGAEGAIDASNIFKPALARGKLRCIGATTIAEYKKYIEKDSALDRRFQKIEVKEPDKEMTKKILMASKNAYEKFHNTYVDENVIDYIIKLTDKYIYDRNEPDKSLDILDEVCAKVNLNDTKDYQKYLNLKEEYHKLLNKKNKAIKNNNYLEASNYKKIENKILNEINNLELCLLKSKEKVVTKEDVASIISEKINIPLEDVMGIVTGSINKLEKNMKEEIIGQDDSIEEVIRTIKKIKMGYQEGCYSFMFMGPSGVGKTMLSKKIGEALAGSNIIKLDMSEYSEAHSVSKLAGSPPGYIGYEDNKNVFEGIRKSPYSVLILDEIEKAHPNVINLFYQILEEGKIKDSSGRVINFKNVTIIMTSNIGFNSVKVGFNSSNKKVITNELKNYFDVAFINRIDKVLVFNKLKKENISKIVTKKIINLKHKYDVKIEKNVIKEIIEECNYNEYGARKIDKIIKDRLETIIIDNKIDGKNINITSIKEATLS